MVESWPTFPKLGQHRQRRVNMLEQLWHNCPNSVRFATVWSGVVRVRPNLAHFWLACFQLLADIYVRTWPISARLAKWCQTSTTICGICADMCQIWLNLVKHGAALVNIQLNFADVGRHVCAPTWSRFALFINSRITRSSRGVLQRGCHQRPGLYEPSLTALVTTILVLNK